MINQKRNSRPIAFVLVLLLVFSMFTPMAYAYGADETDASVTESQPPSQIEDNTPVDNTGTALSEEETGSSGTSGALPADTDEITAPEVPATPVLSAPAMVEPKAAGADRSGWLKDLLELTIKQDGKEIPSGGTLNANKSFEVAGKFSNIPLNGDLGGQFLNPGDWAVFPLDAKLSLTAGSPASHILTYNGETIGTATFEEILSGDPSKGLQVRIVFVDDESVWESYTDIKNLGFNVSLQYDGSGIGEGDPAKDIVILGKTYKIYKPVVPIEPSISKSGMKSSDEKEITWTVTVDAKKGGTGGQSLEGFVFTDNLALAGDYVLNSFDIAGETLSLEEKAVVYDSGAKALTYTFGDITGPKTITYKTQVPDGAWNSVDITYTNSATLKKGTLKATDTATVTIPRKTWIIKTGERVDKDDPLDRRITWYVEVNVPRASLEDITVSDNLNTKLTFKSAKWQKNTAGKGVTPAVWVDVVGGEISSKPSDNKYVYSGITTDHLRLVIETEAEILNDGNYITDPATMNNNATVTWKNNPGTGISSGNPGVGVGFHALTKDGAFDVNWESNHLVNWTVKLDFHGQFPSGLGNFKIYDLLVHDKTPNFKIIDYKSGNSEVAGISDDILKNITPQYGQRYAAEVPSSTSPAGLNVKQIKVMKDGEHIADLIEISGFTADQGYEVKFSSKMLNPEEFIKNGRATAHNTATVFDGTTKRKDAKASPYKDVIVLTKNVLNGATESALDGAASLIGSSGNGFNHDTRTAFFRLSINASGQNLTDTEFNPGSVIVTDTLPEGWTFDQIWNTKGYKIFAGSAPKIELTGTGDPVKNSAASFGKAGERETVAFTFDTLDKHYIILVKAVLTDAAYAEYIAGNAASITVQNDAALAGGGVTVNHDAKVTVKTGVLSKTVAHSQNGILEWAIEYNPLTAAIVASHEAVFIKDTLGTGFELRLTSQGGLDLSDENIYVEEMALKADGTLAVAAPRTNLAAGLFANGDLTYDTIARKLEIHVPDGQKAYRVTYLTDLTGAKDKTVENNAEAVGVTAKKLDSEQTYQISDSDASAMLVLGGYLRVKKIDAGDGQPLAGAKFVLMTQNRTQIREGITAADGMLRFGALREGTYILKETGAPAGYTGDFKEYTVTVTAKSGNSNDGKVTTIGYGDQNLITFEKSSSPATGFEVKNYAVNNVGNLTVHKTVAGNDGDHNKSFTFTVTFTDSPDANGTYDYTGTGGKGDGALTIADSKVTVTLKDKQSVTIHNLPKDAQYTVIEKEAGQDGYTTTSTAAVGKIEAGNTAVVSFTNTKNKPSNPGPGGGGGTSTPPGVVTTPGGVTTPGAITPEAIYGSVKIIKVDGDHTSRTLSGAVFQLFSESGKLIRTSAATASDGVVVFDGLEAGQKYYLKEKTAPAGYKASDQTYSFRLDEEGSTDISVTFKNYQEGTEEISGIDPEEIPAGWIIEEEGVPAGPGELDDTPKTGVSSMPLILMSSLTALTGAGLLLNGIQARRRKLIFFRKGK